MHKRAKALSLAFYTSFYHFLQHTLLQFADAVNFIMNIILHAACEPVDNHAKALGFIKLYDDLAVVLTDRLFSKYVFKERYHNIVADLPKVLLENIAVDGFKYVQYRAAVLFSEIDGSVKPHLQRIEGFVLADYAVHFLRYNLLNQ